MDYKTGKLTEISPLGTGFVEDANGARYGFHYSMLSSPPYPTGVDWPEQLDDKVVHFRLENEKLVGVTLHQDVRVVASA